VVAVGFWADSTLDFGVISESPVNIAYTGSNNALEVNQNGTGTFLRLSSGSKAWAADNDMSVGHTPSLNTKAYDINASVSDVAGDFAAMTVDIPESATISSNNKNIVGVQSTVYSLVGDSASTTVYHAGFEALHSGTIPTDTDVRCVGLKTGTGLMAGAFHSSPLAVEVDTTSTQIPSVMILGDTNTTTDNPFISCFDGAVGAGANRFSTYRSGYTRINTDSTLAQPAVQINQNDDDEPFIRYDGSVGTISTDNIVETNGDGSVNAPKDYATTQGWAFRGMIRVEINGSTRWMPYYDESTS